MGEFFNATVTHFRNLGLFADRGGPIALAQVENEYGGGDQAYVNWCGALAASQDLPIPWLMCNGASAANTVNSCNGGDCQGFIESNGQNGQVLKTQPAAWTEMWSPWFQQWGDGNDDLPAYNGATSVGAAHDETFKAAKWFARGGSHLNWYMYHGGNNYRRMQGAGTRPEYYTGAQLQPDGVGNEPFRSHCAAFYATLRAIAPALLANAAQVHKQVNVPWIASGATGQPSVTGKQYAFVYGTAGTASSVVFIENVGDAGTVTFAGRNYSSNGNSILIIDADLSVVFDTSAVSPTRLSRTWTPIGEVPVWESYTEVPPAPDAPPAPPAAAGSTVGTLVTSSKAYEQLNLTQDDTEWVYYASSVNAATLRSALARAAPGAPDAVELSVGTGKASAIMAFLAGGAPASAYEVSEDAGAYTMNINVPSLAARAALDAGADAVSLVILSESLGIHKFASVDNTNTTFSTSAIKGIAGSVKLAGADITNGGWVALSGLRGEALQVWTAAGRSKVTWAPVPSSPPAGSPLTWYRTSFTAPDLALITRTAGGGDVNASLHLDATGLSRARFYINDWEISRAWGNRNCGANLCQRYYHIPPDVLLASPATNVLTVFDAEGAPNLASVRLVLSRVAPPAACNAARVSSGANISTAFCRSGSDAVGQRVTFTAINGLTGTIGVAGTGLCWVVGPPVPPTSTPGVALATCDATSTSQQWRLGAAPGSGIAGTITSVANSNCVDIPNNVDSFGPVDLWSCNSGANQLWTLSSDGTLVSSLSQNCAGVCAA